MLVAGDRSVENQGSLQIVLSAQDSDGTTWSISSTDPGFFVMPIRSEDTLTGYEALYYDPDSGEIVYDGGSGRRLEVGVEARIAELEAQASRIPELEAQMKALMEKMEALMR